MTTIPHLSEEEFRALKKGDILEAHFQSSGKHQWLLVRVMTYVRFTRQVSRPKMTPPPQKSFLQGWFPSPQEYETVEEERFSTVTRVQRLGKDRSGKAYPWVVRTPEHLRRPDRGYDHVVANVYADFLEEHGHTQAADLLRQYFPLHDGTGEQKEP